MKICSFLLVISTSFLKLKHSTKIQNFSIFIYHTITKGKFKGVNEHAHEVDVIVQVDKGKATSTGRFNACGGMDI